MSKVISANTALIQPKDRDYKSKGKSREKRLEAKTDGIAHALRAISNSTKMYVVVEEADDERFFNRSERRS